MRGIQSVQLIGDITGVGLTDQWDVCGTDLGIPVYSAAQQRMYFLFGDTFGAPEGVRLKDNRVAAVDMPGARNWRGTVAGYTTNFDISKGIQWDGFLPDEQGNARALIRALHCPGDAFREVTKISQGGIEIDGALYVFYESIRHWGPTGSGCWDVNYTGVIKSVDGGATFERVYDLTWVETDRGQHAATIKELAEQDMQHQPSGYNLDLSSHVAPGFGQVFAVDGKDGYIYLYGRYAGRIHGIKVGRVKRTNFEQFDQYEYLIGYSQNKPVWVQGAEGLGQMLHRGDACDIIPAPTSNMCVCYNSYLGQWVLTCFKPGIGIMYSLADACWGPYPPMELMLSVDHPALTEDHPTGGNRLYGGFAHELLNGEQGKKFMLMISQWHEKFYNSKLCVVTFA